MESMRDKCENIKGNELPQAPNADCGVLRPLEPSNRRAVRACVQKCKENGAQSGSAPSVSAVLGEQGVDSRDRCGNGFLAPQPRCLDHQRIFGDH